MRKTSSQSNRIIAMAAVLLCLTLFSLSLLGNIFARYASESEKSNSARAAAFVFTATSDVHQSIQLDVSDIKKPGDSQTFHIYVSNAQMAFSHPILISEVDESYTCTMKLLGDMPLKCELTKTGSTSPADTVSVDAIGTKVGNCTGELPGGQFQRDEYILNVTWPAERKDAIYEPGEFVSYIDLEMVCEQTD